MEVFKVGFGFLAFYECIVYVDLHTPAYLLVEHLVYQSLVGGTCILQSKWYDFIAI